MHLMRLVRPDHAAGSMVEVGGGGGSGGMTELAVFRAKRELFQLVLQVHSQLRALDDLLQELLLRDARMGRLEQHVRSVTSTAVESSSDVRNVTSAEANSKKKKRKKNSAAEVAVGVAEATGVRGFSLFEHVLCSAEGRQALLAACRLLLA